MCTFFLLSPSSLFQGSHAKIVNYSDYLLGLPMPPPGPWAGWPRRAFFREAAAVSDKRAAAPGKDGNANEE